MTYPFTQSWDRIRARFGRRDDLPANVVPAE
jgi:hypothetical protein